MEQCPLDSGFLALPLTSTTNAGPLGKLQFGLTQHGHKTLLVQFCSPSPVMLMTMFDFSVASICSHMQNKMCWLFPWLQGESALQTLCLFTGFWRSSPHG